MRTSADVPSSARGVYQRQIRKQRDRVGLGPETGITLQVPVCLLVCSGSFGLIPLFRNFYLLMITAAFFGLGEALVQSSGAAFVANLCKEKHFGTAMGTVGTIFDIGHAAGPILAGFLLARYDYVSPFATMASLLILAAPVFVVSVDERVNPTNAGR